MGTLLQLLNQQITIQIINKNKLLHQQVNMQFGHQTIKTLIFFNQTLKT